MVRQPAVAASRSSRVSAGCRPGRRRGRRRKRTVRQRRRAASGDVPTGVAFTSTVPARGSRRPLRHGGAGHRGDRLRLFLAPRGNADLLPLRPVPPPPLARRRRRQASSRARRARIADCEGREESRDVSVAPSQLAPSDASVLTDRIRRLTGSDSSARSNASTLNGAVTLAPSSRSASANVMKSSKSAAASGRYTASRCAGETPRCASPVKANASRASRRRRRSPCARQCGGNGNSCVSAARGSVPARHHHRRRSSTIQIALASTRVGIPASPIAISTIGTRIRCPTARSARQSLSR